MGPVYEVEQVVQRETTNKVNDVESIQRIGAGLALAGRSVPFYTHHAVRQIVTRQTVVSASKASSGQPQ